MYFELGMQQVREYKSERHELLTLVKRLVSAKTTIKAVLKKVERFNSHEIESCLNDAINSLHTVISCIKESSNG